VPYPVGAMTEHSPNTPRNGDTPHAAFSPKEQSWSRCRFGDDAALRRVPDAIADGTAIDWVGVETGVAQVNSVIDHNASAGGFGDRSRV